MGGSVDYKMSLKFVVFVCLIFKVSALDVTCPDHVETMPDFNPKLYVGDWYSTFSAYNSYTDETSHCVRATNKELNETFVYLRNVGYDGPKHEGFDQTCGYAIKLIQKMSLDVCLYRFLIFPKIHLEIISSLIRTMKTILQFLVVMKGLAYQLGFLQEKVILTL